MCGCHLLVFFLLASGCAAIIFAVYTPSLKFQFVLDDHFFLTHPTIQESGHIWEYFTKSSWAQFTGGPADYYRPAFLLWLRINFALSGLSTWGWHLLSILKHLFAALLLGMLTGNCCAIDRRSNRRNFVRAASRANGIGQLG